MHYTVSDGQHTVFQSCSTVRTVSVIQHRGKSFISMVYTVQCTVPGTTKMTVYITQTRYSGELNWQHFKSVQYALLSRIEVALAVEKPCSCPVYTNRSSVHVIWLIVRHTNSFRQSWVNLPDNFSRCTIVSHSYSPARSRTVVERTVHKRTCTVNNLLK